MLTTLNICLQRLKNKCIKMKVKAVKSIRIGVKVRSNFVQLKKGQ